MKIEYNGQHKDTPGAEPSIQRRKQLLEDIYNEMLVFKKHYERTLLYIKDYELHGYTIVACESQTQQEDSLDLTEGGLSCPQK